MFSCFVFQKIRSSYELKISSLIVQQEKETTLTQKRHEEKVELNAWLQETLNCIKFIYKVFFFNLPCCKTMHNIESRGL